MKKTFNFFVSAVAVMATLASCVKNEVKVSPEDKTRTVEITAVHDDTKTTLEDGRYVRWSATDVVKAFTLDAIGYDSKTTTVSDDGSIATFTFDIVEDDIMYLAYPAANCESMDNGGNINCAIPVQQTAVANGFADGANVAIGEIDGSTAKMYSVGSLVSFVVKNDDITSIRLEFENAEYAVTGSGFACMESGGVSSTGDEINGTTAVNYVEIKAAENQTLENGAKYFAVVYPETYNGMKLTFTRKDGATASFTNSSELKLDRNSNYTVFNAPIPDSKWQSGETEVIYFKETFDGCNGTGGNNGEWSGNIATSAFHTDNEGWECFKASGADKCAKFGTGSAQGYAITPAITLPASAGGMAELTFKAGKWAGDNANINVIIYNVDNSILSETPKILPDEGWQDYSIIISDVTEETIKIKFEASQSSKNRFFLDDVVVKSYSSSPVEPVAVTGVTLDSTELTLAVDEEFTLTATVNPSNATDKTVTWSSNNESVATVNENGTVTAVAEGEATITVTTVDGGLTATCTVTVVKKAETEYEGAGTEENPYTINDAYKLIDSLGSSSSDEVCVKGTVYKIDSYNSTFHSLTYWIGSEDKPLQVYSGKNLGNTDFSSVNDLNLGDELVVKGNLKKYNSIYEFDKNNWIVSRTEAPKYEIAFASMTNGSVTADVESAAAGREVTLKVTPDSGYKLSELLVVTTPGGNEVELTGNKFIMPASNVTVSATFEKAGDEPQSKTYTHKFLRTNMSAKISSYTESFTNTSIDDDGNTLTTTLQNFNNNNLGWDYVKCGRKNTKSVGTIITQKIAEPIKHVIITVDAFTSGKINSVKLYVDSDEKFSNPIETIEIKINKGDIEAEIASPQPNCYYKIAVDCASGASNGLFQTSKIVYTTE